MCVLVCAHMQLVTGNYLTAHVEIGANPWNSVLSLDPLSSRGWIQITRLGAEAPSHPKPANCTKSHSVAQAVLELAAILLPQSQLELQVCTTPGLFCVQVLT